MTYMATLLDAVRDSNAEAVVARHRRESAIAHALLDGARQADVAAAAEVSQSAISQMMLRRRSRALGARWTIPVLAAYLNDRPALTVNEIVRACAQFSSDFRSLADPNLQGVALAAPERIGIDHLDALVAGLADYEAQRAGLPTPAWTVSSRYSMFPSWFATPVDGLRAWVMRHTPPQFAVRGVFLDARDLESV